MSVQVRHLAKVFKHAGGDVQLFRDLSFDVPAGGSVALVGPSGSGKTTLLRLIAALERPDAGSIVVNGQDVVALSGEDARRFRRQNIGFVYQEHRLLPQLTALENVLLPTLAEKTTRNAGEYRDDARRLLAAVGMSQRETFFPDEMSGGECQRVALARALILRPTLLLADEPTGQLDAARVEQLLALFQQINRTEGVTILMATHSRQAMTFMKEHVVLRQDDGGK
ncbi:MAG: ABC transporter ATP-binding protein [Lentisphaerae bacterium]|jgi:ABC-type lipoprotein export system ATPase subunit|nr:ABC transporter ATP-binding protein [Lentisphaerota bacterium]